MLVKTRAIVLKTMKYSETSLILDVYTQEKGLRSCIVNGVRKSKSKTASLYQIGQILDLVMYDKQSSGLKRIKEASAAYMYSELSFDVVKANLGMFVIDLSRNSIKEEEVNSDLYSFIENWLIYIDKTQEKLSLIPLKFILDLTSFLGFPPLDNYTEKENCFDLEGGKYVYENTVGNYILNHQMSQHLRNIHNMDIEDVQNYKLHKIERAALMDKLILFYKLHLEGFRDLKSLEILKEIF